jgi:SAM-dependent methyltransferase
MSAGQDTWAAGKLYEPYVGRWSRLVAHDFLVWLNPAPDLEWLDVGCGTGALTEVILRDAAPTHVTGVDTSTAFIEYARANIIDPRASFRVGDAQQLPVESAQFDAAVAGLVLNFVPQPLAAVREMARAVRPGGTIAAYLWDYAGKMELMRYFWDAAVALNPAAIALDEGQRFPICAPDPLRQLFQNAGLGEVQVQAIDIATPFHDFDEFWTPFLGGQGPAPSYATSLGDAERGDLRERIRAALPVAENGSIRRMARVWAIRGETPGSPDHDADSFAAQSGDQPPN